MRILEQHPRAGMLMIDEPTLKPEGIATTNGTEIYLDINQKQKEISLLLVIFKQGQDGSLNLPLTGSLTTLHGLEFFRDFDITLDRILWAVIEGETDNLAAKAICQLANERVDIQRLDDKLIFRLFLLPEQREKGLYFQAETDVASAEKYFVL